MKITIQEGKKYYSCDYSVNDKIDGGFLDEYFPPVNEAVDDVLDLLACVYDRKDIGNYLMTLRVKTYREGLNLTKRHRESGAPLGYSTSRCLNDVINIEFFSIRRKWMSKFFYPCIYPISEGLCVR